jgi:hypothetical protein
MRAFHWVWLLGIIFLAQCAPPPLTPTPRATLTPVSTELAAQFALDALHADAAVGRLLGAPTLLRGQVMPLADAYVLANGKPLDEKSPLAYRADRLVWLVVTRGDWLLHIPGGHGDPRQRTPSVLAKDIHVADLWYVIIFDAATGQVYDRGGVAETQRTLLSHLPALRASPSPTP